MLWCVGEVKSISSDLARSDCQKIFVSRKQEQPRERQPSCVDARGGWRMTEVEYGADGGMVGGAVAARLSDERMRGVSNAMPAAAAFPSAETGREARGTTA